MQFNRNFRCALFITTKMRLLLEMFVSFRLWLWCVINFIQLETEAICTMKPWLKSNNNFFLLLLPLNVFYTWQWNDADFTCYWKWLSYWIIEHEWANHSFYVALYGGSIYRHCWVENTHKKKATIFSSSVSRLVLHICLVYFKPIVNMFSIKTSSKWSSRERVLKFIWMSLFPFLLHVQCVATSLEFPILSIVNFYVFYPHTNCIGWQNQ